MALTEKNKKNIVDCIAELEDIELAFVFGSQEKAALEYLKKKKVIVDKQSDLDIGVLINRDIFRTIKDKYLFYGRLYDLFSDIFPVFNLDVVMLNEVSVFIQTEAVKGTLLYQRNRNIYTEYVEELNRRYNDLDFIRKRYFEEMREVILHD